VRCVLALVVLWSSKRYKGIRGKAEILNTEYSERLLMHDLVDDQNSVLWLFQPQVLGEAKTSVIDDLVGDQNWDL
jgi:hypothetical protein